MSSHKIKIHKKLRKDEDGNIRTEIWADIKDKDAGTMTSRLIWWEDDNGIYHDGTPNLAPELRRKIDNAWIEKSRKW